MVRVKSLIAVGGLAALLAALLVGLAGCPSPFLARIKQEIAKAPFTGSAYTFTRQWGNPHPEFAFYEPIVKTDTSGYVYVADSSFRVRKFNSSGAIQSTIGLVSSKGIAAGLTDMAFDASGNMYVATNEDNQIQKYDATGTKILEWGGTTSYGTGGPLSGTPRGIAVDGNSNVYVLDYGNSRVVKFDSAGNYQASWSGSVPFGGTSLNSPQGIAVDSSNNVYVVDSGNSRVVKVNSSGSYQTSWGGATLYGLYALSIPRGISVSAGSTQYVYVVDGGGTNNSRVVKFSTSGVYQTVWGSSGTIDGKFHYPSSVAVDTAGSVYVSDNPTSDWGRVQKFDTATPPAWVASWVLDTTVTDGIFNIPWGAAFDTSGNIYINDAFNGRLQKFDPSGTFVAKVLSQGTTTPFQMPMGLAVDTTGNVYVLDRIANQIQKFDLSLNYVTTWGGTGSGQKQFNSPTAIAVGPSGNIYIADSGNQRVQVLDSGGNYLRQWGSPAVVPPLDGQFSFVFGIAVDSSENVYVSDMTLNRIQKFDSQGTFLAKWEYQGTADGKFVNPLGLAVDAIGNVYVADLGNHRVDKFDSSGNFLAKIGSAGTGNGGFSWPVALAVNASGQVVVSDYTGNLVQEFSPKF